jgi:hypothetical protein
MVTTLHARRRPLDRGRLVGTLLLVQLAGLIVPFVLLLPIVTAPAEWMVTAQRSATRITAGVLLLIVNGAVTIAISIAAWPVFRRTSEGLGLWLLVLGALWLAIQAVDNMHVLSMLSLSTSTGPAGALAPDDARLASAAALGVARRWAHIMALLAIDAWILCFYLNLIHGGALHRAVWTFGLMTVALHLIAIPLRSLLGLPSIGEAGMPMALSHLATGWWLWWRGLGRTQLAEGPARG